VASGRTEYRDRLRAQIVLEAAHGASNTVIAESLNVCVSLPSLIWPHPVILRRA